MNFERFGNSTWNFMFFLLHGAAAAVLFWDGASETNVGPSSTKAPIVRPLLDATEYPDYTFGVEQVTTWNIVFMLATFELLTSLTHFTYFFDQYYNEKTESLGVQYRYIEYSITAPIMMIVISMLIGIRDVYTLVLLAGLINATMLFGFAQSRRNHNHDAHYLGWVPYIIGWAVFWAFYVQVSDADTNEVPSWVIGIIIGEFLLFSSFGAVQMYYLGKPEDKDSEDGLNNLLSLLSKFVLTFVLYGNFISMENSR